MLTEKFLNILNKNIYVDDFPINDGETDDTNRIQRALDAVQANNGGTLYFGPETYSVSGRLRFGSNLTIEGVKDFTKIDARNMTAGNQNSRPYLFQGAGNVVKIVSLTTALSQGQTVLNVPGDLSDVAEGSLLSIRSQERQYIGAGSHIPFKEELQKIVGVDISNSTITVDGGLIFDYLQDENLRVEIVNPISNVTIQNLKIVMGGVNSVHSCIQLTYGYNIVLNNITVNGAENVAINMSRTYKFIVKNSFFLNSTSPRNIDFNSGYGINVTSTSCYGKIENNVFDNCRHGVSGGNHAPHHIEVIGNLLTNCRIGYAIDCHEPCIYWTIAFNTIRGCISGITARGMFVTVSDNIISNLTEIGIRAGATSTLTLPFIKQYIIRNNRITNTVGRAINVTGEFGEIDDVIIQGNVCINTERIRVSKSKNLLISDNFMDQTNVTNQNRNSLQFIECDNLLINNNQLIGVGGYGVLIEQCSDTEITGNLMQQGGSSGTANDGIRAIDCHQLIITDNRFKNLSRHSVFTTNSDNIIFANNIMNVGHNTAYRFVSASNVMESSNMNL